MWSWYLAGSDRVTVEQSHGCLQRSGEETQPGWTSVTVADNNWEVAVIGPEADVAAVVQALQWIDVPGGEAVEGGPTPGAEELNRFDVLAVRPKADGSPVLNNAVRVEGKTTAAQLREPRSESS